MKGGNTCQGRKRPFNRCKSGVQHLVLQRNIQCLHCNWMIQLAAQLTVAGGAVMTFVAVVRITFVMIHTGRHISLGYRTMVSSMMPVVALRRLLMPSRICRAKLLHKASRHAFRAQRCQPTLLPVARHIAAGKQTLQQQCGSHSK